MQNVPVITCQCFKDPANEGGCICGPEERALRGWSSGQLTQPMTPEQGEWCLQEIGTVEGYNRADYETLNDQALARGVLAAWTDYARDKGLL